MKSRSEKHFNVCEQKYMIIIIIISTRALSLFGI